MAEQQRPQAPPRQMRQQQRGCQQAKGQAPADTLARPCAHLAEHELLVLAHLRIGLQERGNSLRFGIAQGLALRASCAFQLNQLRRGQPMPLGVFIGVPPSARSIVGPLVGGALLTAKWSTGSVFMAAATAALCAALAAFSLSRLAGMGGSGKAAADQPASFEAGLRPSTGT